MRLTLRHPNFVSGLILATSMILHLPSQAEVWQLQLNGKRLVANQANKADQLIQEVAAQEELSYDTQGQFIWSTQTRWPGGIEFRYRQTATLSGSDTIDLLKWRDGLDISHKDAEQTRKDFADLAFYHPQLLRANLSELQELQSPASTKQRLWQFKDAAGRPAQMLTTQDGQTIVEASNANFSYHYQSQAAGAKNAALHLQVKRGEQLVADWQLQILPGAALSAEQFKLADDYQPKPERGPLRISQLAAGVYRLDGTASGYHTGIVVGSNSIAIFDAPINPEQAQLAKAAIQARFPGVPIRHLIISHAHRDHISGVPAYADAALKFYGGSRAKLALQRQLGEKIAAQVQEVDQVSEIDLGQRTIRLLPLASSHAEEMLVAYDAQSQTIFQGDLFYLPELGPVPPAFPVGIELKQLIQKHHLAVQHIVGVHGRTASYAEFQQGLNLAQP